MFKNIHILNNIFKHEQCALIWSFSAQSLAQYILLNRKSKQAKCLEH